MSGDVSYTPSEWHEEAELLAKRLRKNKGISVAAMLVVEGKADAEMLTRFCAHGGAQVLFVEGRKNVEGVLALHRENPGDNAFAFLTDCDGDGKAESLKTETALVITQGCDIEADLFLIGAVHSALRKLGVPDPAALVTDAIDMSLPLSIVRRMATKVGVSMKHPAKAGSTYRPRLALADLDETVLAAWATSTPGAPTIIANIAPILSWSDRERENVARVSVEKPADFSQLGGGKDALDALHFLGLKNGLLERTCKIDKLRRRIEAEVSQTTFESWEVGKRLSAWEREKNVSLLLSPGE